MSCALALRSSGGARVPATPKPRPAPAAPVPPGTIGTSCAPAPPGTIGAAGAPGAPGTPGARGPRGAAGTRVTTITLRELKIQKTTTFGSVFSTKKTL